MPAGSHGVTCNQYKGARRCYSCRDCGQRGQGSGGGGCVTVSCSPAAERIGTSCWRFFALCSSAVCCWADCPPGSNPRPGHSPQTTAGFPCRPATARGRPATERTGSGATAPLEGLARTRLRGHPLNLIFFGRLQSMGYDGNEAMEAFIKADEGRSWTQGTPCEKSSSHTSEGQALPRRR